MLRAGGYFVWAAQPVYKHEEALEEQWQGTFRNFPIKVPFVYGNSFINLYLFID